MMNLIFFHTFYSFHCLFFFLFFFCNFSLSFLAVSLLFFFRLQPRVPLDIRTSVTLTYESTNSIFYIAQMFTYINLHRLHAGNIHKFYKYSNAQVLHEEISEMSRVEYDCFVTEVFASRQFTWKCKLRTQSWIPRTSNCSSLHESQYQC